MTGDPDTRAKFKPVVAIEVEGLLVRQVLPLQAPDDVIELDLALNRQVYPTATREAPEWDAEGERPIRVWVSRRGRDWVRSLIDSGTEVVWASTWREYANVYFSDALDLPRLPVAARPRGREHESVALWKVSELARRFDGRPLLWVADDLPAQGTKLLEDFRRPSDRVLTRVAVIPFVDGASDGDVRQMDGWLYLAQSEEGHAELRRIRRKHRRWARERNSA